MRSKWEVRDLESFIIKARQIHGDSYDYSRVVYTKSNTKVIIRCIKHDHEFTQTVNSHISRKSGCPLCAREKTSKDCKKPLSYYLNKASLVHDGKYDYSLVKEVETSKDRVEIICPTHGVFTQELSAHTLGKGCTKCSRSRSKSPTGIPLDVYLDKATEIHGDRYSYILTPPMTSRSYIKMLCKDHGPFTQRADHHLTTQGCPKCVAISKGDLYRFTKEEFIRRARELHGDVYDYSLVDYFNSQTKVTILCPVHGEFQQVPNSHLHSNGCPSCGKYGYQPDKSGSFYILRITEDVIKFGITCNMPRRLREIRRSTVFDVDIIHCFDFNDGSIALKIEQDIYNDPSIVCNVVNKIDMKEGATETTYRSNISKILEYVSKHTPA